MPRDGRPANPCARLVTTAWNRRIDPDPPRSTLAAKARLLDVPEAIEDAVDETTIADKRLELVFTCCHPALALDAQVALTLRTLGGLSTEEIARAFLVPEATMAQAARPREAQGQGRRDPVSPAASSSAFRPPRRGARTDDLAGGDVQHRLAGHRRRRSSSPV